MSIGDKIKGKLASNAEKTDQFILKLLRDKPPSSLYKASRHLIEAGGKRLRPYLVSKSCEIVGGNAADCIPFAAGLEILHNFTLIHDDVIDNDDLRRGVPTVHTKWNLPIAICAGDLLFAKVFEAITIHAPSEMPRNRVIECIEKTIQGTIQICEGQAMDVSFSDTNDISEGEYLRMVGGKTSALFKTCAQVGVIVGGGCTEHIRALGDFAWNSGIAFQIIDDYLGVTADEETLGKPIGSDLREGKKTLIVIHALEHASPEQRKKIIKVLGNEKAKEDEIIEAHQILKETGSIDYALEKALSYAEKAKCNIETLPENEAKIDLLELVDYFIHRTY